MDVTVGLSCSSSVLLSRVVSRPRSRLRRLHEVIAWMA